MTTKRDKGKDTTRESMQYIGIIALSCLSALWLVVQERDGNKLFVKAAL